MSDEQNFQKQNPVPKAAAAGGHQDPRTTAAGAPNFDDEMTSENMDDLGTGSDAGADPTAVLAAKVETLENQIGDLTDRLLRAHADLDNVRKRSEREKQETARYAISKFARDTVEVADNFERAMQAVPADSIAENPQLKALLDGVSMTEREFINVLERHGVKRVAPKGEPFNPHLHQAVMERQDPSVANGTVVEVFQAGYVIEDRCLRPAMVVVARGGPKADKQATEAGQDPAKARNEDNDGDGAPGANDDAS